MLDKLEDDAEASRVHKETKQLVAIKILNLDTAEGICRVNLSSHFAL